MCHETIYQALYLLTAASNDDDGATFGDDVKSRRDPSRLDSGIVTVSRSSSSCRGLADMAALLGVCWSAAVQGREKLPAGDHRDDLPRRCEQAAPADHGRRGHSERGQGISQRGAGRDDRGQHPVELWATMVPWTGSHSARALTRRIQPRTVSAARQVGADRSMALAKGAGQQGPPDDVDHVAAMGGC